MTDVDETRHTVSESADKPWKDKELVNHLYHEKRMSAPEIAEKFDCSVRPIYDRIDETRSFSDANKLSALKEPAQFRTDEDGYERVGTKIGGEHYTIAHHRLVAISEYGVDAVSGNIVHHKNGIPWDNRVENLELMHQSDHVREHFEEIKPHEKAAVFAVVEETEYSTQQVSDMFDIEATTVTTICKRIRDGDYPINGGVDA